MSIELNHTIVYSRDSRASAEFLSHLFGLPSPTTWGPFHAVAVSNAVALDFLDTTDEIAPQHYCFLVGEDDFDAIFGRIQSGGHPFWADPGHEEPGVINTPRWRPRCLFRRPERAQPRDHHPALRRRPLTLQRP